MTRTEEAVRRAAALVAAGSDELLARWAAVTAGTGDPQHAAEWVVTSQRPDGSFGDLPETRRVLSLLDDVGGRGGHVQEQAARWLGEVQAADGHWGEGDAAAFETGVLVGLLARSPAAPAAVLDAAADWLAERFTPDTVGGFQWLPLAGYAAAFSNHLHDAADGILQWCGRELDKGFRTRHFDAVLTARVLLWCDAPSLPGSQLSGAELAEALLEQQEPDGGWPAPRERRLARAWDGLVALLRFGPAA